jgi:hypothetical protein
MKPNQTEAAVMTVLMFLMTLYSAVFLDWVIAVTFWVLGVVFLFVTLFGSEK